MTSLDPSSQLNSQGLGAVSSVLPSRFPSSEIDLQVQRIQRIGQRLFGVARCIVSFGDASAAFAVGERSMGAIEAAFCDSIPFASNPLIVTDARVEGPLSQHRSVLGAPYIRFFAAQPIFNNDQQAIGSVNLIDYTARSFDAEERLMLADLGKLVELELRVAKLSESQLDLQKKKSQSAARINGRPAHRHLEPRGNHAPADTRGRPLRQGTKAIVAGICRPRLLQVGQ
jgi:GAF domain-containing protein